MNFKKYKDLIEKEQQISEKIRLAREEWDVLLKDNKSTKLSDRLSITTITPMSWTYSATNPILFRIGSLDVDIKEAKALQQYLNDFFRES